MVNTTSFSIAYVLFLGSMELPPQYKSDVENHIALLTGIDDYWNLPSEAKWIPEMRAQMELIIRNIFLDFPKYESPEEFLMEYPETISVNLSQQGVTQEGIRHLIENGWVTYIGPIE